MNKKIKKILTASVLGMLVFKNAYYIQPIDNPIVTFSKDDNVAIGLCYHRIIDNDLYNEFLKFAVHPDELVKYSVDEKHFEENIKFLLDSKCKFLTLDEFIKCKENGTFPKNAVFLSFDDADETLYENAFPILKKYNVPFTVFVIASQVGNVFCNMKMCTWDQLNEMKNSGLASFGSHTFDMHYMDDKAIFLKNNQVNDFKEDIIKSKKVIDENLNINIETIAYPFGEPNDEIANATEEAGFKYGFILAPDVIDSKKDDNYWINRYEIDQENFYTIMNQWNDLQNQIC